MASMTKRNAENAKGAKDSANQSRKAAEEGAQTTREISQSMDQIQASGLAMRGAMNDVKSANSEVSKIIKTIDEIAFQTNILALNAAVEAARAGEAGLGFAVVADEVRNLAQKSAESARDTANRIQTAIERSERGTQLSEQMAENLKSVTGQAKLMEASLTGIVGKAQQVDQMVAEIANASVEQNQGIEQVNRAVTEMDKVTQSNAANAEESSSASVELQRQAEMLRSAIGGLVALVRGASKGSKVVEPEGPMVKAASTRPSAAPGDSVRPAGRRSQPDFQDLRR
jgi:methyl-accepting chemotaxis protein